MASTRRWGWDVSAHPLPDYPNRGQGRDEWLRATAEYLSRWLDYSLTLRELIDAGDDVVAVIHETARMRGSDATLDRDLIQVWTFDEGKVVSHRAFKTRDEALEAAGLEE